MMWRTNCCVEYLDLKFTNTQQATKVVRWWRRTGAGINFLSYDVRTFNNKKSASVITGGDDRLLLLWRSRPCHCFGGSEQNSSREEAVQGNGQIATVSKRNDGFKSQRTRPECTRQVLHRPLVGRLPGTGGGRDRGGRWGVLSDAREEHNADAAVEGRHLVARGPPLHGSRNHFRRDPSMSLLLTWCLTSSAASSSLKKSLSLQPPTRFKTLLLPLIVSAWWWFQKESVFTKSKRPPPKSLQSRAHFYHTL